MIRTLFMALLLTTPVLAQERFDPDELFRQAREIGFDGKREESRQMCQKILERYPNYTDVQVFLGRLYSWDGQYEEARQNLLAVLSRAPGSTEARTALVDVELWSGNNDRALEQSEAGLLSSALEEPLLYRKAVALNRLHRSREAVQTLEFLLTRSPANREARSLLDSIETGPRPHRFTASYGYERLTSMTPWQEGSLSLSRETRFGSVVGRFNYANRFEVGGRQVEVDAYPGLARGLHAYLNYGYSAGSIFPRHRVGTEIFSNPGKGLEFSAGFRYLRFSDDVWIYTGSAGKYFGNYFASFRPYITPGTTGTSVSGSFMLRRYYSDSDSYIGFSTGAGSAPDDALDRLDLERLNSYKFTGFGSLPVRNGLYFSFSAGWSSEQLPSDRKRNRLTLSTGVTKRF